MRHYFSEEIAAAKAPTRFGTNSANTGKWPGGLNGPVAPEDMKPTAKVAASPSFEMVDCLPDPTNRDIAYHSIKVDREIWPVEA
jgi:hypothetical protein